MSDSYQLLIPLSVFMIFLLVATGFLFYIRDRKTKSDMDNRRLLMEEERAKHTLSLEREKMDRESTVDQNRQEQAYAMNASLRHENEKFLSKIKEDLAGLNSGGYMIVDIPDNMRSMFSDLLKGFEEYAKLKGYNVTFSIDTSIPNKLAFKFTLQEGGVNVSTSTVRKDIREYIDKVKSGQTFEDIPVTISPEEHILVHTALKNRVNFLQQNYNLEKNIRIGYDSFFQKLGQASFSPMQQPNIYIQTGGHHTPKNLLASNSNNVQQGHDLLNENNTEILDNSSVVISNSFNTRKEQINRIEELMKFIKQEDKLKEDDKQTVITNLDKIKEEIYEEESPNRSRIGKWLTNVKSILEHAVLAHHTVEAAKWIYESFSFIAQQLPH